jgi:hypothetical protein
MAIYSQTKTEHRGCDYCGRARLRCNLEVRKDPGGSSALVHKASIAYLRAAVQYCPLCVPGICYAQHAADRKPHCVHLKKHCSCVSQRSKLSPIGERRKCNHQCEMKRIRRSVWPDDLTVQPAGQGQVLIDLGRIPALSD